MNNGELVNIWHQKILKMAEIRLGRKLSDAERKFVTSRAGFLALEAIQDQVEHCDPGDLERYLNSDSVDPPK